MTPACADCVSDLCAEIRPRNPYERGAFEGHRQYTGLGGWCARGPNYPAEWADNEALIGWLRAYGGDKTCPPGAETLTLDDLSWWAWSSPDYRPWGLMSYYGWLRDDPVCVLLEPEERVALEEAAAADGISGPEYARGAVLLALAMDRRRWLHTTPQGEP